MEISRTLVWAVIGVGLMSLEVATGTFFLVFFGIGALLVAGARLLGLDLLWAEIVLFSAVSAALVFGFRKKVREALRPRGPRYSGDVSEVFSLTAALPAKGHGQVEYQGTTWTAVNESSQEIAAGSRVSIVRTEGVKLFVVPKGD